MATPFSRSPSHAETAMGGRVKIPNLTNNSPEDLVF